jgi:hypothetical protein
MCFIVSLSLSLSLTVGKAARSAEVMNAWGYTSTSPSMSSWRGA